MKHTLFAVFFLFALSACASYSQATIPTQTLIPSETSTYTPTLAPTQPPTPTVTPTTTPIPPILITNGSRLSQKIALTFDLCQVPEYPSGFDINLVNVLIQNKIPATFFVGGDWMRTHPIETTQLASNPLFELGNHSWSHPDFTQLNADEIDLEITKTEDLLFQFTGKRSRVFRLPYGYSSETALQVAAQDGLLTIQWDVVSGDPDPNFDAATIVSEVKRLTQNGSIIVMHANGRGWNTAEALPTIIEKLSQRGFAFVTVSQLLNLP